MNRAVLEHPSATNICKQTSAHSPSHAHMRIHNCKHTRQQTRLHTHTQADTRARQFSRTHTYTYCCKLCCKCLHAGLWDPVPAHLEKHCVSACCGCCIKAEGRTAEPWLWPPPGALASDIRTSLPCTQFPVSGLGPQHQQQSAGGPCKQARSSLCPEPGCCFDSIHNALIVHVWMWTANKHAI